MSRRRASGRPATVASPPPARRGRRWWLVGGALALLLAVLATVLLVRGRDPEGPLPLTAEQANQLALVRFRNFEAGAVEFSTVVPAAGGTASLDGVVDYRAEAGFAAGVITDQPGLLQWNGSTLLLWPDVGDGRTLPDRAPDTEAISRPLSASASDVDVVLVLLASLAADRPENAQLLQQSDARWLREDVVDGEPVQVFAGPSPSDRSAGTGQPLTYWLDASGRARRVGVQLPSGNVSIDLRPTVRQVVPSEQLG